MNKVEKRFLEDVQKACLWLCENASEAYKNSGIEPAIRNLSKVAAMPEQSSHRERLVEAIAPKVVEHFYRFLEKDSGAEAMLLISKAVAIATGDIVDAILEEENDTNS